jgi:hypothetical protein
MSTPLSVINTVLVPELVQQLNFSAGEVVWEVISNKFAPKPLCNQYASGILLELVQEMFAQNIPFMFKHNIQGVYEQYCTLPINHVGQDWLGCEPDFTLWFTYTGKYFEYVIMRNGYVHTPYIEVVQHGIYDIKTNTFLNRHFA